MPKRGHDFFARNQLLSPADEKNQQLHGFLFKLDRATGTAKLVATEVELDIVSLSATRKNAFVDKPIATSRLRRYTKNTKKLMAYLLKPLTRAG